MLTDRLGQALNLALKAHGQQVRKGTTIPYISHPLAVAAIALEFGADEDQAIAALLHDAVEDGGAEYAPRIRALFGARVADIVDGCTDGVPDASGNKGDWRTRKEQYLLHLNDASDRTLLVSGADKLHNARSIVSDQLTVGDLVFTCFKASKAQTLWYYRALADTFTRRGTAVAKALDTTVQRMEQLAR